MYYMNYVLYEYYSHVYCLQVNKCPIFPLCNYPESSYHIAADNS